MRRSLAGVFAVVLFAVFGGPLVARGTAFNPLTVDECPEATALAPGTTVFLFHAGSEEARRSVRAGEVLVVSRALMNGRQEPAGLVRVDAASGALCFRAVVLEGELQPHDVAQANHGAFLVISQEAPCLFAPRR